MATNLLLNQVANEFGGDAINRIASIIGESPGKIKTALTDMLPVILGGIASKAQTREGAHELLNVIHRDHLDNVEYEHVTDAIREPSALGNLMNAGEPLADTVLAGKSDAVSNWVAAHSGITPSSSKSLMSLALPLVLGLIGRRVGNSGESGLMTLLGMPFTFLQDAPSGLAGILGMGSAASAARPAYTNTVNTANTEQRAQNAQSYGTEVTGAAPGRRWLLPLLVVLGLIALAGYFMSLRAPAPMSPSAPVATAPLATAPLATAPLATAPLDTAPLATAPEAAVPALGAFMDRTLPNGIVLQIPANGVENKLLAFIENSGSQVSPTLWFNVDRIEFDIDTATLKPSSQEQLSNIAEIMKAYPQVAIKIGGYTDNTGDAARNTQQSSERASGVMNQLTSLGVDPSRVAAEGHVDQSPAADNATDAGRPRNPRVDINVTKK